jgi:hypothetical protein
MTVTLSAIHEQLRRDTAKIGQRTRSLPNVKGYSAQGLRAMGPRVMRKREWKADDFIDPKLARAVPSWTAGHSL